MRYVDFQEGGEPESMHLSECNSPDYTESQVLIEVNSFGVNRADTLQRKGMYPAPKHESSILGLEVAGVVSKVGQGVTQWQIGDPVFGLVAGGGYAEFVVVEESHLLPIPKGLGFNEAAGIAEVFLTAYQALFELANVQPRQRALIHAGASGVGLAAIQLLSHIDCKVATTASSDEKLAVCSKFGADYITNYKSTEFRRDVKENFGTVDVVVDVVGASYVNDNLRLLNLDGTIVQLAMLGGRYVENLDMAVMLSKRAAIKASTLRNRSDEYKASLIQNFGQRFLSSFETKQLTPVIDTVFYIEDIAQAHRRLESNDSIGKFVVSWQ